MQCRIIIVMILTFTASMSFAKDFDPNKRPCFYHGAAAMIDWYQLDLCLKYRAMKPDVVRGARDIIFKTYPKIKFEIETNSPLAHWAKDRGMNSLPYDFSKKENIQVLIDVCKSDVRFLHFITKDAKWTSVLSCWR